MGNEKLAAELTKIIGDAGKVIWADLRTSDWTVVLDTEYAALKAFYAYRKSDVSFGKATGPLTDGKGWYITVRRSW